MWEEGGKGGGRKKKEKKRKGGGCCFDSSVYSLSLSRSQAVVVAVKSQCGYLSFTCCVRVRSSSEPCQSPFHLGVYTHVYLSTCILTYIVQIQFTCFDMVGSICNGPAFFQCESHCNHVGLSWWQNDRHGGSTPRGTLRRVSQIGGSIRDMEEEDVRRNLPQHESLHPKLWI